MTFVNSVYPDQPEHQYKLTKIYTAHMVLTQACCKFLTTRVDYDKTALIYMVILTYTVQKCELVPFITDGLIVLILLFRSGFFNDGSTF